MLDIEQSSPLMVIHALVAERQVEVRNIDYLHVGLGL